MSVRKEIISGVKYTSIAQYSNIFINLFIGGVLARILTPAEYGTVALITVFVTFFGMFSDVGLSVGIVQFKELSKRQIGSLFNMSILLAIFLAGIFWCCAGLIAKFYNDPKYVHIGHVLCLSIFIRTCTVIPTGINRREKRFKAIGILSVAASIVTGVFGIILAYKGYSYWSLIYRTMLTSFILFVGSLVISKIPFCFALDLKGMSALFKYSSFNFLFNLVNYFSRNLDNLLIGKFLGSAQIGFYEKAYTLMMLPLDNLMTVITPVLHPVLSSGSQNNAKNSTEVHLKLSKLMAMIGVPVSIYFYFCRIEIITIIYGKQWVTAADALKWLSLSIWIQMILSSTGSFFLVAGKTNFQFITGLLSALTMIAAISAGIYYRSIETVAFFIMVAFVINLLQGHFLLYRYVLHIPFKTIFITLKNPVVIGIICFIAMLPLTYLSLTVFVSILVKSIVLLAGLIAGLMLTKEHKWVLDIFQKMRRSKKTVTV
ncbi:MAG: lipopolysaccharide biosynthesis protein [Ferruginibacter sp.]